jgi:hypothetical protein
MAAWIDKAGSSPSCFITAWHFSQFRERSWSARSGGTSALSDAITAAPVFCELVFPGLPRREFELVRLILRLN